MTNRILSSIKQRLLPVSSRSFHQSSDHIQQLLSQVLDYNRLQSEHIDQLEQRLSHIQHQNEQLMQEYRIEQEKALVEFWQLYRKEQEPLSQTKLRFFHMLPQATGIHQLFQRNEAKLFHEFVLLCQEHDIAYWAIGGTILGAYRHSGFIPWDDDVDVNITRDQLDKLQKVVEQDARYRITVVWDWYVPCKQIRFRLADVDNPGFIDLFPVTWTTGDPQEMWIQSEKCRTEYVKAIRDKYAESDWSNCAYIADDHPLALELEQMLNEYITRYDSLCSTTRYRQNATGIIRGIENIDEIHSSGPYPILEWIPTEQMTFCDFEIPVPPSWEQYLTRSYGDFMSLPNDMKSHEHVANDYISSDNSISAMNRFLNQS